MRALITLASCTLWLALQPAQAGNSLAERALSSTDTVTLAADEFEEAAPAESEALGSDIAAASPLVTKRRVAPRWPSEALAYGIDLETCEARLDVDKRGKPYNVVVSGCSEIFHDSVESAAMKWRFYPLLVDEVPREATTSIKLTFRLN